MVARLKTLFNVITANTYMVFVVFLALALAFYFKGYNTLLIDDGIAGLVKFEKEGWAGFADSYGFTSLYYAHDFFNLLIYKVVGQSTVGWFAAMLCLHVLNATLAFSVFQKVYALIQIERSGLIAFAGSLLFLLSPYQTENVLWAATLHYAIAMVIFLVSCLILLKAITTGKMAPGTMLIIYALNIVALLTIELSIVFPALYFLLCVAVIKMAKLPFKVTYLFTRLLLPFVVIIAGYFIATRFLKGQWIPHYGQTHLQNNSISIYATALAKYTCKLLAYAHFIYYPSRQAIYDFCDKWQWMLVIEMVLTGLVFMLLQRIKGKNYGKGFIFLAGFSFILLLPAMNMFFMYLFNTENDRLSYFYSLGFYQIVPYLLISMFGSFGLLASAIYGVVGAFLLQGQVNKWHQAGLIHYKCVESFVWTDQPHVYVLNAPTNYNGVYLFRNDMRLPFALSFVKKYRYADSLVTVMSSCLTIPDYTTEVKILNDSMLYVKANTGGWLMKEFVGAYSYTRSYMDVQFNPWEGSYIVTFYKKRPDDIFIYATHDGFKRVEGF